ncbi:DUF4389 domain-containing protein [Nocardioides ganghwensis]|uniref:DUF4389 domain-containing protein n=1 Tax=Nocardioides ganghwensis TaxID=252230 RepID=A0A4Q2S7I0_9ACTN|nr:DUF4389 domain-containing protein [Nocardioides ganghwensis]MBD3947790.1 DUF4389 domain-containing protein [Nocardioides ganghwensis]RYB98117.1 DUF4389 domain-containing protein [Nocardioides ganghwensis]
MTTTPTPTPVPTPDPFPTAYPVHVDADLDPGLSRGLWLVKWLLAIRHYVVLAFLWLAFAVTSVIAFFAILFTAHYPRALFDFNVGVMRWSWRVAYYAYGALGTDRYPPFTLADVPDYPAHLEVDYPERLSRGLVLVKWWLLAIPHYLVVGLFIGGLGYGVRGADEEPLLSISLIGLLVLVAGVVLLFTGRYPQPVFDVVLGLNRWVLRVAAYVALMTDRYPPFSLDQGGHEPPVAGAPPVIAPPSSPSAVSHGAPAPPPHPVSRSGWTTGRVVALVLGSLLVVGAVSSAGAAVTLVAADQLSRDDDGFLTSPRERLTTDGFAITSEDAHLRTDEDLERLPDAVIGDVRLSAEGTGGEVFVGIGPAADVRTYLADVQHDTLVEVRDGDPVYRSTSGGAPATPPTEQTFWAAEATGSAPTVTWALAEGDWSAVVMNADGSAAIEVDVAAGAEVPVLATVIAVLFVIAALLLLLGAVLVAVPVRAVTRRST